MLHFSTVIASNLLLVDEIMRAGMSSLKGWEWQHFGHIRYQISYRYSAKWCYQHKGAGISNHPDHHHHCRCHHRHRHHHYHYLQGFLTGKSKILVAMFNAVGRFGSVLAHFLLALGILCAKILPMFIFWQKANFLKFLLWKKSVTKHWPMLQQDCSQLCLQVKKWKQTSVKYKTHRAWKHSASLFVFFCPIVALNYHLISFSFFVRKVP